MESVASTQVDSDRFSALDEDQFAAGPTLLDSLTEDLFMAPPNFNLGNVAALVLGVLVAQMRMIVVLSAPSLVAPSTASKP